MPARLASFFTAINRKFSGTLSNHGRHVVVLVAVAILGATTAVYVKTTWNEVLSDEVIAFTALFVATAVALLGFARKKDPPEDR